MHAKKLEKIVKNIENTFAQQSNSHKIAKDDKNLIKQAQNLIKNGPKNIQLKSNASNKTQRTPLSSGLAPQLKLDRHFNNISLNKSLNKSLDKSQESHISTITKATNRNISV